jgi:hypothetical protein
MKTRIQLLFLCIALVVAAVAQQPQEASREPQGLTATIPSSGFPGLDRYRASRIKVYMNDFGELFTANGPWGRAGCVFRRFHYGRLENR